MPNPAAKTATGPMSIAAAEQYLPVDQRVVDDDLAYRFLPSRGIRFFTRLSRWRAWRAFLVKSMGEGLYAIFLCRKRYIDEKLIEALADGLEAVVILGAGFDTRGYRLVAPAGVPLFEVDLPEIIELKRAKVGEIYGEGPGNTTLVPVDFENQDLGEVLASYGYLPDRKTFFVWEAVTQYLTEGAVRSTFDFMSTAATGSRLVFTYVRKSFIDGTDVRDAERRPYKHFRQAKHPLFRYGLDPDTIPAFLREYGWHQLEQVGAAEYLERYIKPSGRGLPVLDTERAVCATRFGHRRPGRGRPGPGP